MKDLFPNPWLLGLGITLLCFVFIQGLKRLLVSRLSHLMSESGTKWQDILIYMLRHTTGLFILGSSLYIAFQYIPHKRRIDFYVDRGWFLLLMFQFMLWGNILVDRWVLKTIGRKTRANKAAASSISLFQFLAKFVVFSVIFLFTLNNMNIKITTMLAGLGVGGIAAGLALQKILGDMFSSLSIVMDKPFVVGDFIITNEYLGEVEKIGLRTTHIRSLSGEQIIISNSDLLSSRIRNMNRMHERRVVFMLSLTMDLSHDDILKVVSIITNAIKSKSRTRFDRCHLQTINRTSLDFETVYFVLHDDYNIYMDIQQSILLDIWRTFAQEGIKFAYPTQTVYLADQGPYLRIPQGMEERRSPS